MIITCATIEATALVLGAFIQAHLRLGRDYRIAALDGAAPVHITVLADLPTDVLRQLCAIPDTTIA